PEPVIDQARGERLNIAVGETEFIDIALSLDTDEFIHLQKYHNIPIGIKELIDPGKYEIILIFSGDNFEPYKLRFVVEKEDVKNRNKISLRLIKFWK
ncbi:MAG: hypothetical protein AABX84_02825, partial [Nanoarchaeota archaeon]